MLLHQSLYQTKTPNPMHLPQTNANILAVLLLSDTSTQRSILRPLYLSNLEPTQTPPHQLCLSMSYLFDGIYPQISSCQYTSDVHQHPMLSIQPQMPIKFYKNSYFPLIISNLQKCSNPRA